MQVATSTQDITIASPQPPGAGWRVFAARAGGWLAVLLAAGAAYAVASFLPDGLRPGPTVDMYVLRPALWLTVAAAAWLIVRRLSPERPRLVNRLLPLAALAGAFHVAVLALTGIVFGFGHSPYGDSMTVMAENAFYVATLLAGQETARAALLALGGRRLEPLNVAVVALAFGLAAVPPGRFTHATGGEAAFQLAGGAVLPALSESLLSTLLALNGGPIASFAYRAALEGFRWLSPILPDLEWGVAAFVGTLTPAVALFIVLGAASEPSAAPAKRRSWAGAVAGALGYAAALLVVGLLWLSTGLLGVRPSLVAGHSMEPALHTGDVVLTREVDPDDIRIGDIVRFRIGDTEVLHRVIEIYRNDTGAWFVTKGDNNEDADRPIQAEQIEGRVVAVIPKVGWVGIWARNTVANALGFLARADEAPDGFMAERLDIAITAATGDAPPQAPPECAGMIFDNVIVGTEGDDELVGTNKRDLILGLGGNDVIAGDNQADCLDGGPGNDLLTGANGKDVVVGGPGNDLLFGDNGVDLLYGGDGDDELHGDNGDDRVDGGPGVDVCDGGRALEVFVDCEAGDFLWMLAPTPTATPTPTASPTDTPSPTPTPSPTFTPTPTPASEPEDPPLGPDIGGSLPPPPPTDTPSPEPTPAPTSAPEGAEG